MKKIHVRQGQTKMVEGIGHCEGIDVETPTFERESKSFISISFQVIFPICCTLIWLKLCVSIYKWREVNYESSNLMLSLKTVNV